MSGAQLEMSEVLARRWAASRQPTLFTLEMPTRTPRLHASWQRRYGILELHWSRTATSDLVPAWPVRSERLR